MSLFSLIQKLICEIYVGPTCLKKILDAWQEFYVCLTYNKTVVFLKINLIWALSLSCIIYIAHNLKNCSLNVNFKTFIYLSGKTVQKAFTSFSDAILQIDCISCIRAILNTQTGIRHLLGSSAATNKLIMGRHTSGC